MRVTMEDIARMAGVSKATVSRVVNGIEQGVGPETRRRVLQIVKETNYRSYSLPSQNQSKTLGLIIPDIINPFFGELGKKRIYSVNEEVFGFRCMTVIIAELISSDRY